jgi:plasmid stability protein
MIGLITSSIMRTTLDLDPSVIRELRERGAREHKSMGALASELLAQAFADSEGDAAPPPLRWVSRDLGTPRVDLEDKEALHRVLDDRS